VFACVGWQVALCDPIWQVTLRSLRWNSINSYTLPFLSFILNKCISEMFDSMQVEGSVMEVHYMLETDLPQL